jgi:4-nitrophenyl phosphatase
MLPANIKALIIDMDGVIWKSGTPIGDLPAIFTRIRERGLKFVFATNNSTQPPQGYAESLASLGVTIEPDQVITSSAVAANLLSKRLPKGSPIFVIGEMGLRYELMNEGFELLSVKDAENAKAVVFGIDREITFDKVREATLLVRNGVPFYATNPDMTFPTPRGEIPGNGAWVSVITTATNIQPIYAGKPFPAMIELSLQKLGTIPDETIVVGDRLETDIASGQAVGCKTALVLSGVSTRAQADAWTPPPTIISESLSKLIE